MPDCPESVNPPHLRWNYAIHVLDGGLYMGSQAVLNANTVLTTAIAAFGGPAWLIALMPSMMVLGVCIKIGFDLVITPDDLFVVGSGGGH